VSSFTFTGFEPIVLFSFTGYTSNWAEMVPHNFTIFIKYMYFGTILIAAPDVFRVSWSSPVWLRWRSFVGEKDGAPLALLASLLLMSVAYWLRRGRCRSSHWSLVSCMCICMLQRLVIQDSRSDRRQTFSAKASEMVVNKLLFHL